MGDDKSLAVEKLVIARNALMVQREDIASNLSRYQDLMSIEMTRLCEHDAKIRSMDQDIMILVQAHKKTEEGGGE